MRRALSIFGFFLLSGCSADYLPQDYLTRLENTLSASATDTSLTLALFPAPRALTLNLAAGQLSIREFLSLRECRLHVVLAKRNSLMGKVATASQLFFNDLDILASGPACIPTIEDPALAKRLQGYLNDKQSQIGASMWLAILGSNENRAFWQPPVVSNLHSQSTNPISTSSIAALTEFVNKVQQGHYQFTDQDYNDVEQNLGQLRFANGGSIYYEFARLNHVLEQANEVIRHRLDRPLCFKQKTTSSARYLENVVNQFFIPHVQQMAVDLGRQYHLTMPAYLELENTLLPFAPPAYQQWVEARKKTLQAGQQATHNHVLLIQQLYAQCGLVAGNRKR